MILLSMAVEASQITLFPAPNREMICQGDASRYDDRLQTAYGNRTEKILPMYRSGVMDMCPAPDFMAESGLTSSLAISRKRSRDSSSFNQPFALPKAPIVDPNQRQFCAFEFLGEDISSQIYQQQLEIDRFVDRHTEKVRTEIEEMRRRNLRRLAAVYEAIMNRLKTKEEQILKIGRLNRSLEEKVESISVENQIWRELAQTSEATANALRNDLQQVLTEVQLQQQQHRVDFARNDDAQSHCGSNFEEDHREAAEDGGGERKVINPNDESEYCKGKTTSSSSRYGRSDRPCRNCGKEESCVLLLPCRHLCVCSLCVSSVNICPVCRSTKSAGVHVNMS